MKIDFILISELAGASLLFFILGRFYWRRNYYSWADLEEAKAIGIQAGQSIGMLSCMKSPASGAIIVAKSNFFKRKTFQVVHEVSIAGQGIFFLLMDVGGVGLTPGLLVVASKDILVLGESTSVFKLENLVVGKCYVISDEPITKRHADLDESDKGLGNHKHTLYAELVRTS